MRVDSQMFARFANLKESEVEEFRHSVAPDFIPEHVWGATAITEGHAVPAWKVEQGTLRAVWDMGFTPEGCIELITSVAQLSEQGQFFERVNSGISKAEFGSLVRQSEEEFGQPCPPTRVYPFQKVVMLLHLQPWRAQICAVCGRYWIKETQRDRYCSAKCSKEAIRRRHNQWFREVGSKQRERRGKS